MKVETSEKGVIVTADDGKTMELSESAVMEANRALAPNLDKCKKRLIDMVNDDNSDPIALSVAFSKYRSAHCHRLKMTSKKSDPEG